MARYQVHHGEEHYSNYRYVVWDSIARKVVFQDDSKVMCIAMSQDKNGFRIDGSEQSYAKQTKEGQ